MDTDAPTRPTPKVISTSPVVVIPINPGTMVLVLPPALEAALMRQYEAARRHALVIPGRQYPERLTSFEAYCIDLLRNEAWPRFNWGAEEDTP